MNPQLLLNNLPPFNNSKILIKKNQSVNDIIKALNVAHNQYKNDYDKIALQFLGHSNKQTAYNIWKFLKKNVPYKAEPESMQTIKSPSAIIKTGLLGEKSLYYNDCKNYSLFAGGILSALNRKGYKIPFVYRFASYNLFDKEPGHVFIVINPGKNEIWLDPVLKQFNYKKSYIRATDKNFDMMYSINGIENMNDNIDVVITGTTIDGFSIKKFGQSIAKAVKDVGKAVKSAGKVVLTFAASPARNAFLLLVKLNFRSLATNLKRANEIAPSKLQSFWEGIGGRYQSLLNQIEIGSRKKRLGTLGVEPVTTAAAVTSATPIIVKIVKILKDIGIEPKDIANVATNVIKDQIQKHIENKATQQVSEDVLAEETADRLLQSKIPIQQPTGAGINKNILLIAGVGAAAYLLLRKK